MATGYTMDIAKGITFPQFAMRCARAFGACVTMRDDGPDVPIPDEFKPSPYHVEQLVEVRRRLKELDKLTLEEAENRAKQEYERQSKQVATEIKKSRKLTKQYTVMLEQVKTWKPPTPDHVDFKNFMVQQIESSIKFDGMEEYYKDHPAILLSGPDWLKQEKAKAMWEIDYHTKENQAEIERVASRNMWIKTLRESLA